MACQVRMRRCLSNKTTANDDDDEPCKLQAMLLAVKGGAAGDDDCQLIEFRGEGGDSAVLFARETVFRGCINEWEKHIRNFHLNTKSLPVLAVVMQALPVESQKSLCNQSPLGGHT